MRPPMGRMGPTTALATAVCHLSPFAWLLVVGVSLHTLPLTSSIRLVSTADVMTGGGVTSAYVGNRDAGRALIRLRQKLQVHNPKGEEEEERFVTFFFFWKVVLTDLFLPLLPHLCGAQGYENGESLSVAGQVKLLIAQAQSPENLAMMYPGWAPWI